MHIARPPLLLAALVASAPLACGGALTTGPGSPALDGSVTDAAASLDAAIDVPEGDAPPKLRGLSVLGSGRHSADAVRVREVATREDGLDRPRDVAFNPEAPDQLWVTNFGSNSITVVLNPGGSDRSAQTHGGPGADHFLVQPSALAFGAPGFLATAQETNTATQRSTPADFMGPTLWDTDLDTFNGGHASHLDMLHNSPNSNGIAWESGNVFWVVDGAHGALARYDFGRPHERGGEDHSDGTLRRYVEGMLMFSPGISAHIEFDHERNVLYFTQPATNRLLRFDPANATVGARVTPNYDGDRQNRMTGGTLQVLVNGVDVAMRRPSGLALAGGVLYVTDNATSQVIAFDRDGLRLDWLDLSSVVPTDSLQGITTDERGFLYVTESVTHRVIEIAPRDAM
jgi:sugar lactone lactonase YvrE